MTFRAPPRTSLGHTGLGAVGGPTGVGAGALRVIVEFLTQYDADKVKQLEADLLRLEKLSQLSDARQSKTAKARAADDAALFKAQNLRLQLNSDDLKVIKEIRDLERTRGTAAKQNAQNLIASLSKSTGLRRTDIELLVNQDKLEARVAQREARRVLAARAERARQSQFHKQQVAQERQLFSLQQLRAQLIPKLGSLALGAVGGILGGAVLGVGFAAAQAALEKVGEGLTAIIDPGKKAREVIQGVVADIDSIAESEGLSDLEAAAKFLSDFGAAGDAIEPTILADATAVARLLEKTEALNDILEVVNNLQEVRTDAVRDYIKVLADLENQTVTLGRIEQTVAALSAGKPLPQFISPLRPEEIALAEQVIRDLALSEDAAAQKAAELARQEEILAGAGNLAAYAQDQLADAINRISGARIQGLQDQLQALSDAGPSARTQALTQQIENLAEAQARSAYQSQLQALAEERALILLEQRIKLQGQVVNLEQLSGRAALVAIDARISALQRAGQQEQLALQALQDRISLLRRADQEQDERDQKALEVFDDRIEKIQEEGAAQERVNQLLDIQYRLSQKVTRQQGESIADFISRRANEERQLLAERDAAIREGRIAAIQAQRDEVAAIQEVRNERREAQIEALELRAEQMQAEIEAAQRARDAEIQALQDRREAIELQVRLEENAEQRRQVMAAETLRQKQKNLQEELAASQERDRKETESRRAEIEKQIQAIKDRTDEALKWAKIEEAERLRTAALAARTYTDAQTLIGQLAGAERALAELEAYARANQIAPAVAEIILGPLRDAVRLAQGKVDALIRQAYHGVEEGPGFAKGGIVTALTNASTPFGQNARFGEEGQEIGIILSNRVARILQEQTQPRMGAQTFIINRSDDPYLDKQRFGRVVRDAMQEALG